MKKITELNEKEFKKFEQNSKYGNFFQSVERAKLRRKMGFNTYLIGLKEKDNVSVAGLIVERDGEAWIQIGPILDYNNTKLLNSFLDAIIDYAKSKKFVKLEIFPPLVISIRDFDGSYVKKFNFDKVFETFKKHGFAHEGFTTKIENKANRWMFVKDLSDVKTFRDAELSMNASTRKKLHKTERELEIKVLKDKKDLPEWLTALQESDKRNGVHTRNVKYFEDLWDAFGENAIFVEARRKDNGELVSSEVDIIHPNEMVAFVAGTIEKNKKHNGSIAIKGFNIEECLKRKIKRLNLYGMEGDFSPNNPLLYFKNGPGGYTEEYIGGFCIVLNKQKLLQNKIKRKIKSTFHIKNRLYKMLLL